MPFPHRGHFRKGRNWLVAMGVEAAGPGLRLVARWKTGPPSDPRRWRKAILLGANHLGDLLYRSASLGPLKAGLPDCEFHYLTEPGSAPILERNPAITSVLPWVRSDSPLDLAPEHVRALRGMGFDAALCTNSGMYWGDLLLALRLGIGNRVGYDYRGFSGWVTRRISMRYPQSYPAYFREYVAELTGQRADWPLRPVIHPDAKDEEAAAALWERLGLAGKGRVLACFMTTRQPTGVWAPANFGKALRLLRQVAAVVLCGAAGDGELLAGIDREFDLKADIVAGGLGLRALACFLGRCQAVLTTDSGPRHIANAAGVPVYFFRNLRSHPVETGAYLDTETDFCPVSEWMEPGEHAAILSSISPESVAATISGALLSPPSA